MFRPLEFEPPPKGLRVCGRYCYFWYRLTAFAIQLRHFVDQKLIGFSQKGCPKASIPNRIFDTMFNPQNCCGLENPPGMHRWASCKTTTSQLAKWQGPPGSGRASSMCRHAALNPGSAVYPKLICFPTLLGSDAIQEFLFKLWLVYTISEIWKWVIPNWFKDSFSKFHFAGADDWLVNLFML